MGAPVGFSSLFLFTIFSLSFLQLHHPAAASDFPRNRETIEIIIGGGGEAAPSPAPESPADCPPPPEPLCPPPPPPPCPPHPPPPPPSPHPVPPSPSGFESELIAKVYPVIQALKFKIKYDPFGYKTTWRGKNVCRDYKGFVCSTRPDKKMKAVAGVDFNGARFDGEDLRLEGFVDKLPDLAFFHANSNNFTGVVPKGVADIKYLYELDFSNNKLTGAFPVEVLNVKYLSFLDIRYNQLTGTVPAQVFGLTMLDALFINNNHFSQKLPDNLGDTTVVYLTFANNQFTGPIPKSIGRAKRLQEVLFLNNQLSGCLPHEIGLVRNLTIFDAGSNQLTGPIPWSFGCLSKIQELNLAQNRLYGAVPEMVCKLPNIANLSLSYNYFTQVGPECRKLIKKKRLDVRMNCILDLPDQRPKSKCAEFFSKPYYCPNQNWMKWVPCKIDGYLKEEEATSTDSARPSPSPSQVTYNALLPHKP